MFNLFTDTASQADATSMLPNFILFGVLAVVFIFAVVLPQKKRDKEQKEKLNNMRIGDTIITIGGIVGILAKISDDEVTIYSSTANTPITFQKAAIQTVISRDSEKSAPKDKKEKKSKKTSDDEE
jgi:preprotein translocase subunit YajC